MLSSYNNYIFIKNEIQSSNINTKSGIIIIHILIVVNQSERGDFTKKRVISVLKLLIVQKKNSWNQMNQFHDILWIFFHINPNFILRKWKNIQKMPWNWLISWFHKVFLENWANFFHEYFWYVVIRLMNSNSVSSCKGIKSTTF